MPEETSPAPQSLPEGLDNNRQLTRDAKDAVNAYLKSQILPWLKLFGIGNLAVIATSVAYVFFILPKEAYSKAEATVQLSLAEQTKPISSTINGLFEQVGVLGKTSTDVTDRIKKLSDDTMLLQKKYNDVNDSNLSKVSTLIAQLKDRADIDVLLNRINEVERRSAFRAERGRVEANEKAISGHVAFTVPFKEIPAVAIGLTHLDEPTYPNGTIRISVRTTNVTTTGFDYTIGPFLGGPNSPTYFGRADAEWIAVGN